jgi:hypothetical protein
VPLFPNKLAVREVIRVFAKDLTAEAAAPPADDVGSATAVNILGLSLALTNDLPGYLALAGVLPQRPFLLPVGRAAAASDHDRLLRLLPTLMANNEGPGLTAATIFLGDRDVHNDVSLVMQGLGYDQIFADVLALLAGTLETIKLDCRIHEQVQVLGTRTADQILPRLELLWQGKNPDDDTDALELNNHDKLLVLTAALAAAPH